MTTNLDNVMYFLHKVSLFQGLSDAHLRKLAKNARERDYNAGDIILEQGKLGVGLFIMMQGEAKVEREQVDGTLIELDRLRPTEVFGEISLLDDTPRVASVIAMNEVKCLVLDKPQFLQEISEDAEIAVALLKTLAGRYRRLVQNL
ncbi:MAG: cyclic nucleotide-binding domain-containing protein [Armatimonadetes bacterium]|nr:cyclic nucleotide-binding domain-containing protein [Anaerolineae bacterium]